MSHIYCNIHIYYISTSTLYIYTTYFKTSKVTAKICTRDSKRDTDV